MTASEWPSLEERLRILARNYDSRAEVDPERCRSVAEVAQDLHLLLEGAKPVLVPGGSGWQMPPVES